MLLACLARVTVGGNVTRPRGGSVVHFTAQNYVGIAAKNRRGGRAIPDFAVINIEGVRGAVPQKAVSMEPAVKASADVRAARALFRRAVTVPVNVIGNDISDISTVDSHVTMLAGINLAAGPVKVVEKCPHRWRPQPERGPHSVGVAPLNIRLIITVARMEMILRSDHPRVIGAAGTVGGYGQVAAANGHGVGDINGIAMGTGQPIGPFIGVEGSAVEFIAPHEIITGGGEAGAGATIAPAKMVMRVARRRKVSAG